MEIANINVVLVEDEDANISAWTDHAEMHNADCMNKGFKVSTIFAKSAAEAQSALVKNRADAIVVDLRLRADGQAAPNDHGNDVVRYAHGAHPVAIAVYTGQRQEAEVEAFPQVEVFDRGEGLEPVFDWLAKQRGMLQHLQELKMSLEAEIARVFFGSVWPRWSKWTAQRGAAIKPMLFRHVVAHIHDNLMNASNGVSHPDETYFVPPIKPRADTGDIIRDGVDHWVVVTPRCDLANEGKISMVLLAQFQDISMRWKAAAAKERNIIAQHDRSYKNHFMPEMVDSAGTILGPWFVDFTSLKVVPIEGDNGLKSMERVASLTPQFIPSLVERFGAYFSRIGTPVVSQL
ncbi:histidine kinase [Stenotrophomonas acidaminiphila]|uniref:histidine kinase n=1 Tax=Stenotrophomonas acidaminiphila TaxID=128780 RepID=UPI0028B0C409|nr:histidine kinase [Stenotrophomonas acidaminiphila]